MKGLGILLIAVVIIIFSVCYYSDILIPFFMLRKQMKETIRHTDDEVLKKHYEIRYKQMKMGLIPVFGRLFIKLHKKRLRRH